MGEAGTHGRDGSCSRLRAWNLARSTRFRRATSKASIAALCLLVAACGTVTRAKIATSVDEISQPKNYDKLRKPAHAIASAVADGVLDSLGAEARELAMSNLIDTYVDQFGKAAARGLDMELGPVAQQQLRASVRGVLDEILAESTRAGAADVATRLTNSVLRAIGNGLRTDVGPGISAAIGDIGPAFRKMLERELGPGVRSVIENDLAPAMAKSLETISPALARTVEESSHGAARGAALGIQEAWGPALDHHVAELKAVLASGRRDAKNVVMWIVIGGLCLALGGVIVALRWRHVLARQREDALHLIVEQIKKLDHHEGIQALVGRIRDSGRARPGGQALASYLHEHPSLKVDVSALTARSA